MYHKYVESEEIQEAQWDVKSCVRCVAGANLDTSNLPDGTKYIAKGTPLMITDSREVKVVKTATVVEAADAAATSLSIAKGSMFAVGDTIAGGTISAIDTSNEEKDVLTVSALEAAVAKGDVVDDGNGSKVVGLCYCTVKIEDFTSVTWTIQAYEIDETSLPYPFSEAIKTALTSRHHFAAF